MPRLTFNSRAARALLVALAAAHLASCDQFDPTAIENPTVTDTQFLATPAAARTWLRGVEREYLLALNTLLVNTEIASDNYFNNYTTQNKVLDALRIENHDTDVRAMFTSLARLREAATYGIERVIVADTAAAVHNEAELRFLRAMGSILVAENFTAMPAEALGPVLDATGHLALAIDDLTRARSLTPDDSLRDAATLALARAHYRLGDREAAVREATALLAAAPSFLRTATFDGVGGPSNSLQGLLTSATNNYQPLPRLDFLDPKFPNRGAQIQSPLPVLKAEEAHLILAEAALAAGDLPGARARLQQLLALVESRATEAVDARTQRRGRAGGTVIYPDAADYRVAFREGGPHIPGLVLTRQGPPVHVPVVSGTSVTSARLDALATIDDAYYVLYLMRQEIFLGEGRRASDLGIRFPVPLAEAQTSRNADLGAPYMSAVVPEFLPAGGGMDAFVLDSVARTVEIRHDLNAVLVANRTSPLVLPFAR